MSVVAVEEIPLVPPAGLGPYRRDDYLRLPDEPRYELIYGRFYLSPSPSIPHQVLVTALWMLFDRIAQETGGFAVVAPMDVTLAAHSVVQPDVVYVAAERRGIIHERLEGAPSLVVEILSPGTVRRDRGEKLRLYAESGVEEYWIVDPTERQIEFLVRRGEDFVVDLPSGSEYRSRALPEVRFDVEAFWESVERRLRG